MRRFIARHFPTRDGGRFSLPDDGLSVNLSFVLHERSDSSTVSSAIRSIRSAPAPQEPGRMLHDGQPLSDVDLWLAPSLGLPQYLESALNDSVPLTFVDRGEVPLREVPFFRAPARLTLPDDTPRTVGIAALILRPGGRSSQLIVRGPFAWPADQEPVLRALESLIQSHVEQWQPRAILWSAPAEETLPELK